ncbi:MAG: YjgP/YjgQ family permease [Bacteroidetes bacterium]|nr:YjgP/YjgQ family permease [Bacteroidota bacterium]
MFKLLDKYIIRKYLSTFLFTVLIFTLIAMAIDFSEKIEKFIEEPVTVQQIILDYYANYIPYINGLLWPLYALIAVIFFTSRMAYNSEIISILNAGVSFRRMMMPYLFSAFVIGGGHLVANHLMIPKGNNTRLDFEHSFIWKDNDKGKIKDVHMFLSPDTKVYIRYYRKRDTSARDFRMERFKDSELVYLLKAGEAKWVGPPNKWSLRNYEIRTFDGMDESLIIGKGKKLDTAFNLFPNDFVRYINQKEMMTTPQLNEFIRTETERGIGNTQIYEIEVLRRTAEPFSILILTLIGMSVASRKVRGGMGLHLAIGVGLGAVYIFLSKFTMTFATNQAMPIVLGVWLPNIIFFGIAVYLMIKAQK